MKEVIFIGKKMNKPDFSFVFKIFRKNPPFVLFILAALSYIIASIVKYNPAWTWVSNFLWGGIILQIIWIIMVVFSKR